MADIYDYDIDDYIDSGTPTPNAGGYNVEDFLDTTVSPPLTDQRLRDEALQLAYGQHPGLEELVEGTHQMQDGAEEFSIGMLAWAASFALESYSSKLSVIAGIMAMSGFGVGAYHYSSGLGKVTRAAKMLENDGYTKDLVDASKNTATAGMGESLGFWGGFAASRLMDAKTPFRLGVPLVLGMIGRSVAEYNVSEFDSNLDELLKEQGDIK